MIFLENDVYISANFGPACVGAALCESKQCNSYNLSRRTIQWLLHEMLEQQSSMLTSWKWGEVRTVCVDMPSSLSIVQTKVSMINKDNILSSFIEFPDAYFTIFVKLVSAKLGLLRYMLIL